MVDRIRYIHWNAAEAEERAGLLREAGLSVVHDPLTPAGMRALRAEPPDVILIDLTRAPSQGRDLALGFRKHRATRRVPLVFVGGEPKKVARIRDLLPDATYTTWSEINSAVSHAISNPVAEPVVHESVFAAYAGTPLPRKLGVTRDSVVTLLGGPDSLEETLGELPSGVVVRYENPDPSGVTVWFVRSRRELEEGIKHMGAFAVGGRLWIAWPKKASAVVSDLTQQIVREAGLASGLVDFRICSIDETWSGLRFSQRK